MPKRKKISVEYLRWFRLRLDRIIFLIIFGFIILLSPGQNVYVTALDSVKTPVQKVVLPPLKPHPYPINRANISPHEDITATGIVIMDVDSGVYLYKRNENIKLAPASTTKLLTALVILENFKLDDVMTFKNLVNDGQTMGLISGEKMSVENLLYGALIHSGNDAAYTLADNYPGGVDEFVKAMNRKAQDLHLTDSEFTNPVGYDDPSHKMTPLDLARLAAAAIKNEVIAKMVAIPSITISDVTHTYFHSLKNVNQLLGKIPGVSGIKTGWTQEAGENLVTLVERNGHKVIFVVLRSGDRFGDTEKLIDWVFTNFNWIDYKP
jgi:serine-type D-Ala-D-Ala carboxypeptidase (penicillin-binding protein 5/6)